MKTWSNTILFPALQKRKKKFSTPEEALLRETKKILHDNLFEDKKILQNLKQYAETFEFADETTEDLPNIFSLKEIKDTAIQYRLKFLESRDFKPDFPYEAILKIKDYNRTHKKDLKHFFVLSTNEHFRNEKTEEAILFAETCFGNYLLLHKWGSPLNPWRRIKNFHLRDFDHLFVCVVIMTLLITLSLPTELITLDDTATYWSGYRVAAFFHLLIFNLGVTAYITFAFTKNLSASIWNQKQDF